MSALERDELRDRELLVPLTIEERFRRIRHLERRAAWGDAEKIEAQASAIAAEVRQRRTRYRLRRGSR